MVLRDGWFGVMDWPLCVAFIARFFGVCLDIYRRDRGLRDTRV
jgi:hypothetical protein